MNFQTKNLVYKNTKIKQLGSRILFVCIPILNLIIFNSRQTLSFNSLSIYIYISTSIHLYIIHMYILYLSVFIYLCVFLIDLIHLNGIALRQNGAFINHISIVASCFASLYVHFVKHNPLAWMVLATIKCYCNVRRTRAAYVPVHHILHLDRRFLKIYIYIYALMIRSKYT